MLFARDIEYRVENVHSGLTLCIGGDREKGLVTYIHHYGFYEGGGMIAPFFLLSLHVPLTTLHPGASNEYRIDPALLLALLTGSITQECVDVVSAKVSIHPSTFSFLALTNTIYRKQQG
jgi:hypothetical protein